MRIPSVVVAFIAGISLSLSACGGVVEPEQTPAPESATVDDQAATGDVNQMAICPLRWTCDWTHWYGTQALCASACGGAANCTRDYYCTIGCTCP